MKFFGIWTVLVALSISVVAAYYSIVGLVAIFAASVVPVIIMGSVLEVGKITTAIWLHIFWDKAGFLIKTYLVFAVALLMFITSMGIFGFLSKAHIEQNAVALEGIAQLSRIETEIQRSQQAIERSEEKIIKLETADSTIDTGIQDKIDVETARITAVYDRLTIDIEQIDQDLDSSLQNYQTQIEQANIELALIAQYVRDEEIKKLQGLIGAKQDGRYGPKTAEKVEAYRIKLEETRDESLKTIDNLRAYARVEITRIRNIAESSVEKSNELINRLRENIGLSSNDDEDKEILEQRNIIKLTEDQLGELFEKKYDIESEARKLEAEVGPVKYIAELIYGNETDRGSLEDAVRWVIIILVIVFDPLAVVLVIAGITLVENSFTRKTGRVKHVNKPSNMEKNKIPTVDKQNKQHHEEETLRQQSLEQIEIYETRVVSDGLTQREIDDMRREQHELNQLTRKIIATGMLDEVINNMKEQDASAKIQSMDDVIKADKTGELEKLLSKADPETLEEVYNALMNHSNK